jgi:hypothetical protein
LELFATRSRLINRTSRALNVRYDGEDIVLRPGDNPGFPKVAIPFAKKQNILMGSRHPVNPTKFISLVGIKDSKDDCSPIPDDVLARADKKLEAVDRSGEFYGQPMRNVKVLNHGFDPFEAGVASGEDGAIFGDANSKLDRVLS